MAEWLQDLAVGQWYAADGEPFEIIGLDADSQMVLVQHYDGTLEDFDFETWMTMAARACAPPTSSATTIWSATTPAATAAAAGTTRLI